MPRHTERYRKVMMREMTLAEALAENERDWQRFLASSDTMSDPNVTAAVERAVESVLDLIERQRAERRRLEDSADRLYRALAFFDTRDGSYEANVARAAREGYERCEMHESGAWTEFDYLMINGREHHRQAPHRA